MITLLQVPSLEASAAHVVASSMYFAKIGHRRTAMSRRLFDGRRRREHFCELPLAETGLPQRLREPVEFVLQSLESDLWLRSSFDDRERRVPRWCPIKVYNFNEICLSCDEEVIARSWEALDENYKHGPLIFGGYIVSFWVHRVTGGTRQFESRLRALTGSAETVGVYELLMRFVPHEPVSIACLRYLTERLPSETREDIIFETLHTMHTKSTEMSHVVYLLYLIPNRFWDTKWVKYGSIRLLIYLLDDLRLHGPLFAVLEASRDAYDVLGFQDNYVWFIINLLSRLDRRPEYRYQARLLEHIWLSSSAKLRTDALRHPALSFRVNHYRNTLPDLFDMFTKPLDPDARCQVLEEMNKISKDREPPRNHHFLI